MATRIRKMKYLLLAEVVQTLDLNVAIDAMNRSRFTFGEAGQRTFISSFMLERTLKDAGVKMCVSPEENLFIQID